MFDKRLKRNKIEKKYNYYHVKNKKVNNKKNALKYMNELVKYLNKFEYNEDSNFIFTGRKKYLYDEIIRVVKNEQKEENPIYFILGDLEEFMCNPECNVSKKDILYKKNDYICSQEKQKIIELIDIIKNYLDNCIE